jgi:hypothetical protein
MITANLILGGLDSGHWFYSDSHRAMSENQKEKHVQIINRQDVGQSDLPTGYGLGAFGLTSRPFLLF